MEKNGVKTMTQGSGNATCALVRSWRRLQFSLRTLLAAVTLCGLLLGWAGMWLKGVMRQGKLAAAITERGAEVTTEPAGPKWLASMFGEEQFVTVTAVRYGATTLHDSDLALLRGLSGIERLSLDAADRKGMTDAGLRNLAELTKVDRLHLGDTGVTDEGLKYLREWSELEWLCLSGTRVSDAGLVYLKGMKKLKALHLSRTAITDAGLEHLSELDGLRLVYLGYTKVSDAGIAHLKEAMPDLWIVTD